MNIKHEVICAVREFKFKWLYNGVELKPANERPWQKFCHPTSYWLVEMYYNG